MQPLSGLRAPSREPPLRGAWRSRLKAGVAAVFGKRARRGVCSAAATICAGVGAGRKVAAADSSGERARGGLESGDGQDEEVLVRVLDMAGGVIFEATYSRRTPLACHGLKIMISTSTGIPVRCLKLIWDGKPLPRDDYVALHAQPECIDLQMVRLPEDLDATETWTSLYVNVRGFRCFNITGDPDCTHTRSVSELQT